MQPYHYRCDVKINCPPPLDFTWVSNTTYFSAMVDDFEKKYKALDIPYPKDTTTAEIAAEEAKQVAAFNKFVTESKARLDAIGLELIKVGISNKDGGCFT